MTMALWQEKVIIEVEREKQKDIIDDIEYKKIKGISYSNLKVCFLKKKYF